MKVGQSDTIAWNPNTGFAQGGYKISDTSLCSINGTTIKALKAGNVTITMQYWDRDHGYSFTYNGKKYTGSGFATAAAARAAAESKISSMVDTSLDTSYGSPAQAIAAIQERIDKVKGTITTYDEGGMVEKTGLVLAHAKEGVLTPEQVDQLRQLTLTSSRDSLAYQLAELNNLIDVVAPALEASANNSIVIENATVEMNVGSIANDYEARRAGEQALEKMLEIARKTSVQTIRR